MANEKRLIDANDLWSDIMMLPHNGDMISSDEVEQAIKEAPTMDAVEVVRCKDCKRYEEDTKARTRFCRRGLAYMYAEPNGFCSYGERKDHGQDVQ